MVLQHGFRTATWKSKVISGHGRARVWPCISLSLQEGLKAMTLRKHLNEQWSGPAEGPAISNPAA